MTGDIVEEAIAEAQEGAAMAAVMGAAEVMAEAQEKVEGEAMARALPQCR